MTMMISKATTQTKLTCVLANGKTAELTLDDCVAILNAMARRHMLCVLCEEIPSGYSEIWTEECCAWKGGTGDECDECVMLSANTATYVVATPIVKKVAKKVSKKK